MRKLAFISVVFSFTLSAFGATWVTNRDHSEIQFQAKYMGVSELTGRFNDFKGEVEVAEDGSFKAPLTVRIKSTSIDTGNRMRDSHLRKSDFFYSQKYPEITFVSDKLVKKDKTTFEATGKLTIKGITKDAVVSFETSDVMKDTWGHESRFVKFKSSLNRKDFDMNWNKTLDGQEFLVGDEIAFFGVFQMQPPRDKTPNSKHMIPDNQYIRERDLERQKNESSLSKKIRALINGK